MRKLDKFGTWIRSCLILSILCIFAVCAQAQTVSGVVKDASGDAIIGATVRVSGTNTGTVTEKGVLLSVIDTWEETFYIVRSTEIGVINGH